MSATRSTVTCWRWPFLRRLFCRRRFLKMITLSSRSWAITVAVTVAPATLGAPMVTPASVPTASTSVKVMVLAGLAVEFLDLQDRVGRDAVLLSAGADDCEHG